MKSVVIQLQEEALDREVRLSDLLRKALVIAKKLGLADFKTWVENELHGYSEMAAIPEYRKMHGQVRGWHPHSGWEPIIFQEPEHGNFFSHNYNRQSVAVLESLLEGEGNVRSPFPQKIQRVLSKPFGFETEINLFISRTEFIKVLDAVRNIILTWALKLEADGILGEGLTFNSNEKTTAASGNYNINNFFGTVNYPQLQQGAETAIQSQNVLNLDIGHVANFLNEIKKALPGLNLSVQVEAEIDAELQTIQAQTNSPQPKFPIIREGLKSIRSILENAGGGVATHLLIELSKMVF